MRHFVLTSLSLIWAILLIKNAIRTPQKIWIGVDYGPGADKPLQKHSSVCRSIHFVFVSWLFTIEKWFSRTIFNHLRAESKLLFKAAMQRLLLLCISVIPFEIIRNAEQSEPWSRTLSCRHSSILQSSLDLRRVKPFFWIQVYHQISFLSVKWQTHYSKFVFLWFVLMHNGPIEVLDWQKISQERHVVCINYYTSHLSSILIEQNWQWQPHTKKYNDDHHDDNNSEKKEFEEISVHHMRCPEMDE